MYATYRHVGSSVKEVAWVGLFVLTEGHQTRASIRSLCPLTDPPDRGGPGQK